MQGRGLLTFLILMSLSFCAYAQDDFETLELESPPAEAAPALEPPAAEPDPTSVLTPKTETSGADEFTEFEESGGATPPETQSAKPPEPSTPEVKETAAPETAPAQTVPEKVVQEPKATPLEEPVPPEEPSTLSDKKAEKSEPVFHTPSPSSPAPVQSLGGDEPDYAKEEQFHQIYEKYNSQPTSDVSWGKVVSEGKAQIYEVQSGDTLWDISQTLFGDAQFWPKVWSINNQTFPNPHEITPSAKIQFFSGGLTEAPTLAISGGEKPVVVAPPLAKNEVTETPTVTDASPTAVFPKQTHKSKVLKRIPDSLPIYRFGGVNRVDTKVEIINARRNPPEPLVSLSCYVAEGETSSVGTVIETEHGGEAASEFQYVILELNTDGKIFHIVRESEKIKSPYAKGSASGKMIEVQGEVEILEKVSDEKNYYRAIVKKAILPVTVGSQVLSGPLPLVDVVPGESQTAIEASLIGGQYSSERKLYPRFSFVFLDAGSSGGLSEGQTLNVFANLKVRNDKSVASNLHRRIGQVKIIKTSENFSTAYVTAAFEDLHMGDLVGGGAQTTTESPETATDKTAEESLDL